MDCFDISVVKVIWENGRHWCNIWLPETDRANCLVMRIADTDDLLLNSSLVSDIRYGRSLFSVHSMSLHCMLQCIACITFFVSYYLQYFFCMVTARGNAIPCFCGKLFLSMRSKLENILHMFHFVCYHWIKKKHVSCCWKNGSSEGLEEMKRFYFNLPIF